jgi:hypothetical protein
MEIAPWAMSQNNFLGTDKTLCAMQIPPLLLPLFFPRLYNLNGLVSLQGQLLDLSSQYGYIEI